MDFIFSLAHFCEVHGPTSVLCTQALPQPCQSCEHSVCSSFSSDSSPPKDSWSSSPFTGRSTPFTTLSDDGRPLESSYDTPPSSPSLLDESYNPYFPQFVPKESTVTAFGGGLDVGGDTCANCSFDVPTNVSAQSTDPLPASHHKDTKVRAGNPVLKTKGSVLVFDSPSYDDVKIDDMVYDSTPSWTTTSATPSMSIKKPPSLAAASSVASSLSNPPKAHAHHLIYLTMRQPTSPAAFSLLRRSCIRTLSCENLPRGSPSGPILFGDHVNGYTIAFIFRLPDKTARGRRRTYALIALGGRDSWRATAAMVEITRVFTCIANWIVGLAEKSLQADAKLQSEGTIRDGEIPAKGVGITPVSSFLLAKQIDPDGFQRSCTKDIRGSKTLAEIVGRERVFVDLHVQFVRLLAHLGRQFAS